MAKGKARPLNGLKSGQKAKSPSRVIEPRPPAWVPNLRDLTAFMRLCKPIEAALSERWPQSTKAALKGAADKIAIDIAVATAAAMNGSIGAWLDLIELCNSENIPFPAPLLERSGDLMQCQKLPLAGGDALKWPVPPQSRCVTERIQYEWMKTHIHRTGEAERWREEIHKMERRFFIILAKRLGDDAVREAFYQEMAHKTHLRLDRVNEVLHENFSPDEAERVFLDITDGVPDLDIIWQDFDDEQRILKLTTSRSIATAAKTVRALAESLPKETIKLLMLMSDASDVSKVFKKVRDDYRAMAHPTDWSHFDGREIWPGPYYIPSEAALNRMGRYDLMPAIREAESLCDAPYFFRP